MMSQQKTKNKYFLSFDRTKLSFEETKLSRRISKQAAFQRLLLTLCNALELPDGQRGVKVDMWTAKLTTCPPFPPPLPTGECLRPDALRLPNPFKN